MRNPFKFFDGITVINLDKDLRKWVRFMDQAVKYGFADKVVRVSGVYHKNGAYGCAVAHRNCMDIARQKGWSNILIMEDDVKFLYNPSYIIEAMSGAVSKLKKEKTWDLFYLGLSMREPLFNVSDLRTTGDIIRSDRRWFGRFAYAANHTVFDVFDNIPDEKAFTTYNRGDVLLERRKDLGKYVLWPAVASVFPDESSTDPGRIKEVDRFIEDNYLRFHMTDAPFLGTGEKVDVLFAVSSYNRPEGVARILDSVRAERSQLSYRVIVLNDGSTTGDYERFRHEPDVLYLENPCNYGRKRYWESINRLFEAASGFSFRVLVQVDDDFVLCRNFLQEITRLSESGDGAVHYHINDNPGDAGRWGLVHWVDGGCAFSYRVMKALNFRAEPVAPCRWMRDPNASSGVWHNISNNLNKLGITVTKPDYSMAVHRGNHDSKMNSALRKEVKIHSHY